MSSGCQQKLCRACAPSNCITTQHDQFRLPKTQTWFLRTRSKFGIAFALRCSHALNRSTNTKPAIDFQTNTMRPRSAVRACPTLSGSKVANQRWLIDLPFASRSQRILDYDKVKHQRFDERPPLPMSDRFTALVFATLPVKLSA